MKYFKKVKMKIHKKLLKYPAYVKLLQVPKRILAALLAFFDFIGPCLTFLCTRKPDNETGTDNGIM